MKNLDISDLPDKLVSFWWLSKLIKYYDELIISKAQQYRFGDGGRNNWHLYRGHIINVKNRKGEIRRVPIRFYR